jgi:hypothetical protein
MGRARLPRLTRTIAVTLRAGAPGGRYNDAYADDVALIPRYARVPGVPPYVADPARRPRPAGGVAVLSRRAGVDRKRRAWVRLGCARPLAGACAGIVTLTARLPGADRETVVGSARFRLARGKSTHVRVPLFRRARPHFPRRRGRRIVRLHGHVYTAGRDRRGATRTTTAPLRLERPRRR